MGKLKQGFTALELIVTMAIVAILLATGVPAFKNYSWNLRMKSALNALQADLNQARGHAISHNIETVICPALSSDDCSGLSDWEHGWIIFADLNGDRRKQAGEPLLKQATAIEFLRISSSRGRSYLRFYPNGNAPGSNITILFCDQRGADKAAAIAVSNTGRIRMEMNRIESSENCP
jgi:type IV fimbrial biogenesis protein FimT